MADVSKLRANINGVFETFNVKDKIARENTEKLDKALSAAQIVDSASGAIASFPDGADDIPDRSLTVDLEPIQDLHGYDHPWPAGGGKNLFDEDTVYAAYKQTDGSFICTGGQSNYTRITIPEKYIGQAMTLSAVMRIPDGSVITNVRAAARINGSTKSGNMINDGTYAKSSVTFTPETAEDFIYLSYGANGSGTMQFYDVQWELGSEATDFAPYSNICPISGRDSVTVTRTGANLFDKSAIQNGYIDNADGLVKGQTASIGYKCTDWIRVNGSGQYYIKTTQTAALWGAWYDKDKTFLSGVTNYANAVITAPQNAYYFRLTVCRNDNGNADTFGINYPSTDHDYHAYDGQSATIQLGQTVYGGSAEIISGQGRSTMHMVDLGTLRWTYFDSRKVFYAATASYPKKYGFVNIISSAYKTRTATSGTNWSLNDKEIGGASNAYYIYIKDTAYSDVEDFKTAMSGVQACYELNTPVEFTTDPVTLSTLKGQNNVWSDADSVTVDYVSDPKLYIDKKIAEAISP